MGTFNPIGKLHVAPTELSNMHYPSYGNVLKLENTNTMLQIIGDYSSAVMSHILLSGASDSGNNTHWFINHFGPHANDRFSIGYKESTETLFSPIENLAEHFSITPEGNVGIGDTTPDYKLDVVGYAGKTGGGSWSDSSDIRLKTNITDLDDALSRVLELSPKEYYRLDREEKEIGLIADDVLKIFPKWVGERNPTEEELDKGLFEEDDKVKILTFPNEFNAVIVEAVKELKEEKDTEIQELKEENRKLKELICLEYPEAEICKTE